MGVPVVAGGPPRVARARAPAPKAAAKVAAMAGEEEEEEELDEGEGVDTCKVRAEPAVWRGAAPQPPDPPALRSPVLGVWPATRALPRSEEAARAGEAPPFGRAPKPSVTQSF